MNELAKIQPQEISGVLSEMEVFSEKVKITVATIASRLPNDLTSINVIDGDDIERQAMGVYSQIDEKLTSLKKKRMDVTRIFDSVKSQFTEKEGYVSLEISKIKDFSQRWNSEKLKRRRAEDEKKEDEMLSKKREQELISKMTEHYFNLSMIAFREMKQKAENLYYECKTVMELNAVVDRMKNNVSQEKIAANFQKQRDLNPFILNGVHDTLKFKEIIPKIVENEKKYIDEYHKILTDLISFSPSQAAKIQQQNEADRAAEIDKLKAKQAADDAAMEAELQAKMKADEQARAVANLNEMLVNATPAIEMSKGTSVRMNYECVNHSDLLKVIQWYIHNVYAKEDFKTLAKRLSFMVTAANKALNDTGEVIEGVPTKEDVTVRKTVK